MAAIKATFDGKVFVPDKPLDLPVGTAVQVIVPSPPRQLTEEEQRQWQRIRQAIEASEPLFATFDDYLRSRGWRP